MQLLGQERWRLDSIVARLLETETLDEPEIYAAAAIDRPAQGTSVRVAARTAPH